MSYLFVRSVGLKETCPPTRFHPTKAGKGESVFFTRSPKPQASWTAALVFQSYLGSRVWGVIVKWLRHVNLQLVPIWFAFMVSAFLLEIGTTTVTNHVLGGMTMRKTFFSCCCVGFYFHLSKSSSATSTSHRFPWISPRGFGPANPPKWVKLFHPDV